MAGTFLTCPLCGFEFERTDALCHHGCPLGAACHLARCPVCEYEFPETLPAGSWLRKLFGKKQAAEIPPIPKDGFLTVRDLKGGDLAEVLCLGGDSAARRNNLAVFGLVPGSEIRVIQRYPSYVIGVGETVLALESDVAGDIVVRRAS
jgi:Fe2+ transport system protein FeoA